MKKCPNCRREIDPSSSFCEYCGYQLRRTKKPWWIVVVVVSLLIATVSVLLLVFSKSGSNTQSPIEQLGVMPQETPPQYVFINAHELRLRFGPSTDYDMLKKPDGTQRYATRDEKFLYKGESSDFYKVEYYDGKEYWVSRKYAYCVQGSPSDDWATERRIRGLVSDFSVMSELASGAGWSMVHQLFAPNVERYHDSRNETVDQVAQHYAKYDDVFGVYGKHSKPRWNTLTYYKSGNRYIVTYIEDYTIDRYDNSKYSIFVLEKHIELNSDFKIVSVYDVQKSKRTKQD